MKIGLYLFSYTNVYCASQYWALPEKILTGVVGDILFIFYFTSGNFRQTKALYILKAFVNYQN